MLRKLPLFLLIGCVSCASQPKSDRATAAPPKPISVGRVAMVNDSAGFVLIDVGTSGGPPPGQALKSFSGETETGILTVSPESKRPFIVADIVRGEPQKGDEVFR